MTDTNNTYKMKKSTIDIFRCDHCNKLYQIKRWAELHEAGCYFNPENKRACLECAHLCKKNIDYWFDTYHGESGIKIDVFYCDQINSALYPPKVETKKNWFEFGDVDNQPMKKDCEFFKAQQMMTK